MPDSLWTRLKGWFVEEVQNEPYTHVWTGTKWEETKARVLAMSNRELEKELLMKGETMLKKLIVEFKRGDAPAPGRSEQAGRPFLLKLPIPVTVPPVGVRTVKLGLSCNLPCVVSRRGGKSELFGPDQELEVTIKNSDTVNPLVLGQGEVVAQCLVIDNTDVETVDA